MYLKDLGGHFVDHSDHLALQNRSKRVCWLDVRCRESFGRLGRRAEAAGLLHVFFWAQRYPYPILISALSIVPDYWKHDTAFERSKLFDMSRVCCTLIPALKISSSIGSWCFFFSKVVVFNGAGSHVPLGRLPLTGSGSTDCAMAFPIDPRMRMEWLGIGRLMDNI